MVLFQSFSWSINARDLIFYKLKDYVKAYLKFWFQLSG